MQEKMKSEKEVQTSEKQTKEFHYDAFISYRHCDLDKFVAENIHKQLEAYRMPSDIAKKRQGMKNRIERVFRDQEELPLVSNLNDPIMAALHNSDWLIVICSPRLRESVWCKKEIETFISLHGREKVLAVLIEGEPAESFPDELLFKTEVVTKPDGSTEEVKIPVEPLAADVRGKNKKEVLQKIKAELLRILAAMFGMNYDDLRQRHKEQAHKRKMRYMTLAICASVLVAAVSIGIAVQMNHKNQVIQGLLDQVDIQNEIMKEEQAVSLADKALDYLEDGDKETALQYATWASTRYDILTMPETPEARYALAECLGVYNTGEILKAEYRFETMGIITHMDVALDKKTVLLLDDSGTVTLFDTNTREVLLELYADKHMISADGGYAFLQGNRLAYLDENSRVCVYNYETDNVDRRFTDTYAFGILTDEEGSVLAIQDISAEYAVYEGQSLEYIGMTPDVSNDGVDISYISENRIMAYAHFYNGIEDFQIHFIDLETMQEISSVVLEDVEVEEVSIVENRAYVLASYYSTVLAENRCSAFGIDISTGEILWENSQYGYTAELMSIPGCEVKEELLVLTSQTARLVNMQTGETGFQISLDSTPVAAYRYADENSFEFFCEDGSLILLTSEMDFDLHLTKYFDCRTEENRDYMLVESGVVVLPSLSNQITVYEANRFEGVTISDVKEVEQPFCYYDETAIEFATEYGLDKAEFVKTLFFDENKMLVFASYWNGDFIIYDSENNNVVAALEDCDTMYGYLGTDADGNIYLQGMKGGYILSCDNRFAMYIPGMIGLDLDQNKVYLQGQNTLYEAPIYSFEELTQLL